MSITTTNGEVFTKAQHSLMAQMVFIRFGRDLEQATAAWCRMMENNCSTVEFQELLDNNTQEFSFPIKEVAEDNSEINCKAVVGNDGLVVCFEGYGDKGSTEDHGSPLVVELYNGELRVIVWGDINSEDPTHIINLEGAKESNRK